MDPDKHNKRRRPAFLVFIIATVFCFFVFAYFFEFLTEIFEIEISIFKLYPVIALIFLTSGLYLFFSHQENMEESLSKNECAESSNHKKERLIGLVAKSVLIAIVSLVLLYFLFMSLFWLAVALGV